MSAKPIKYADWASSDITENVTINNTPQALPNKIEPIEEFKISGELYRENLPRPYINYQFNLINQWIKHLDQRYSVGDIFLTVSAETVEDINARLGGEWTSRGTQALGTIVANVWEKTE